MKQNKYEGLCLTNGRTVNEWINSFSSAYEKELAQEVVDYCLMNGYELSEFVLKSKLSNRYPTLTQKPIVIKPDVLTSGPMVFYVENKHKYNGFLLIVLIIIGILISAFLTNPNLGVHQDVLRQRFTSIVMTDMNDKGKKSLFMTVVGGYVVDNIVDIILDTNLQYNNYILFSTTSIDIYGTNQLLSFGIFGKIFTIPKEELERITEEFRH